MLPLKQPDMESGVDHKRQCAEEVSLEGHTKLATLEEALSPQGGAVNTPTEATRDQVRGCS